MDFYFANGPNKKQSFLFVFVLLTLLSASLAFQECLSMYNAPAMYAFPNGYLTNCTAGSGVSPTKLNTPIGLQVYNSTYVYVAELYNNRVVRVNIPKNTIDAVFGQKNASSVGPLDYNNAGNTLNGPYDLSISPTGRMYVADTSHSRVVFYDNATSLVGGDHNISGVIGQSSLANQQGSISQTGLNSPSGVFVDSFNRLWIADTGGNRALWYDNEDTLKTGAAASGVIGVSGGTADFTARGDYYRYLFKVVVDTLGKLYADDGFYPRIVRYDNATVNTPSYVFGQKNLTASGTSGGPNGLNGPYQISFDYANDRLVVADTNDNRVVIYSNASSRTDYPAVPDIYVGQTSSSASNTQSGTCSATSVNYPLGVYYDSNAGQLWISDTYNQRILAYCSQPPISTSATTSVAASSSANATVPASLIVSRSANATVLLSLITSKSANATIKASVAASRSANATVLASVVGSGSANATKTVSLVASRSANATKLASIAVSRSANATIKASVAASRSANATVLASVVGSGSADATIPVSVAASRSANATKTVSLVASRSANATKLASIAVSRSANATKPASVAASISAKATVLGSVTATRSAEATASASVVASLSHKSHTKSESPLVSYGISRAVVASASVAASPSNAQVNPKTTTGTASNNRRTTTGVATQRTTTGAQNRNKGTTTGVARV